MLSPWACEGCGILAQRPWTAPYPSVRALWILWSFGYGVCYFSIVLLEFAILIQVGIGGFFCLVEGFAFNSFFGRRFAVDYVLLEVLHRNLSQHKVRDLGIHLAPKKWKFCAYFSPGKNAVINTLHVELRQCYREQSCLARRRSKNSWNQWVFWVERLVSVWTRRVWRGWGSRDYFEEARTGAAVTLKDS